jgi:hypothetical protein
MGEQPMGEQPGGHPGARRFLAELRRQTYAELGLTEAASMDPVQVRRIIEDFLRESLTPEQAAEPEMRRLAEETAARTLADQDTLFAEDLARMQAHIEATAAARIDGLDLGPRRPLVGYLRTGQLNAVSMRVPGADGGYLVLFEDEMMHFARLLGAAVAWALPRGADTPDGRIQLELDRARVEERIAGTPGVAQRFTDLVTSYAVTGRVVGAGAFYAPPGYFTMGSMLSRSLQYFVLGHEYAHILVGHLDSVAPQRGVLPVVEAEAMAYSWQQELDADWLGMVLSINAGAEHGEMDVFAGFAGIGLFFDALEVMDQAVALLQTGDENARQLGSHPPAALRRRRLRDFLPQLLGEGEGTADRLRAATEMADTEEHILRLFWEHTRPALLDLRRQGVPAARTWRTIPKETPPQETAPAPRGTAPAPRRFFRRWGPTR